MLILAVYVILGILAFAAYPKLPPEGKAAVFFVWPVHVLLGLYATACLTHQGRALDNPAWWIIGLILGGLALCGL